MADRIYFYRVSRKYIKAVVEYITGRKHEKWKTSIYIINRLLGTSIRIPRNNAGINLKKIDFYCLHDLVPIGSM